MTSPKWWRATIPRGEYLKDGRPNPYYGYSTVELGESFEKHGAERWVIGEETGEDGYEHWQAHIVFSKGKTLENLRLIYPMVHWTPSQHHNFEYEEKEGKYIRSWEKALTRYINVPLWPWQKELLDHIEASKGDDRHITFLLDDEGCSGKTFLSKHLVGTHKAAYCPPLAESKDYMAWALAHSNAGCFILDMPRAESFKNIEKEAQLWSAIEQMKNGYLYDQRHQWREKWIDPPTIIVIANWEPRWECLSKDRWIPAKLEGSKGKTKWINWVP